MHKKRNQNFYLKYDVHIIKALKSLNVPLITFDKHEVYFDENKRRESIYEHIANKEHHLHVVDIKRIPKILKNIMSLSEDKYGRDFRCYIGKRGKKNEKQLNLKIVTKLKSNNKESIVTIYPI